MEESRSDFKMLIGIPIAKIPLGRLSAVGRTILW